MSLTRRLFLALAVTLLAAPLAAAPSAQDVARTLRIGELADILREEGLAYAEDLEAEMLPGGGGDLWQMQVREIYDPARMVETVTEAFETRLDPGEREAVQDFFGSDLGQTILTLEITAREAMADDAVEEIARETYADLADSDDPRLEAVDAFVTVNDLMERNVAGALSSNYQFYRGLVDGGAMKMGEDQIIADVWAQEGEIREDTRGWLYGYLLMAYRPLSQDDLQAYIDFSRTEAGGALNAALFDGFDEMYRVISYALGQAVAQAMAGSDL